MVGQHLTKQGMTSLLLVDLHILLNQMQPRSALTCSRPGYYGVYLWLSFRVFCDEFNPARNSKLIKHPKMASVGLHSRRIRCCLNYLVPVIRS